MVSVEGDVWVTNPDILFFHPFPLLYMTIKRLPRLFKIFDSLDLS